MERTPKRARPAALAALALAVPMMLSALPAAAAPETFVYDALGDSYAAGFGTAPAADPCAGTQYAYPHVVDGQRRIALDDFVACSGATTASLAATQLGALDADTDLVTVSIGGNDIAWVQAIVACLIGSDAQCSQAIATSDYLIDQVLPPALDATYAQIAAAAPNAHVVVTGYPQLFTLRTGPYYNISAAEQQAMNRSADRLNAAISDAAQRHGFQFVDVTNIFKRHGVNAADAWIGGIEDPELFHPTITGQEAYGNAVAKAIPPRYLR